MAEGEGGTSNGWAEWRRHVLIELEQHRSAIAEQNKLMTSIASQLTTLQTEFKLKSGMWGFIGSLLGLLLLLGIGWLTGKIRGG